MTLIGAVLIVLNFLILIYVPLADQKVMEELMRD